MKKTLALCIAVGLGTLVSGCDNKCPTNQPEKPNLYLTVQKTSRIGIPYDVFFSEQTNASYLDYFRDGVVDIIVPPFDITLRRREQEGTENMFKDADRELAEYRNTGYSEVF